MFKDNLFMEDSEKLINTSELNAKKENINGITIEEIEISSKESKIINRNKGKYTTITFKKDIDSNILEELINIVSSSIKNMMEYLKLTPKSKVLFIGLGNKNITSDKFGYNIIEKIALSNKTFKIHKDVEGLTNIKSVDFTKSLAELLEVDLIIVFDSLKANNLERLGTTIQLSTGGLFIGHNNKKYELSKKTVKKNIISIGVPTIINMKDIENINPDLLVSTKDIDEIVDNTSSIVSIAINRIL